jgi:hypothetical protein
VAGGVTLNTYQRLVGEGVLEVGVAELVQAVDDREIGEVVELVHRDGEGPTSSRTTPALALTGSNCRRRLLYPALSKG